jgi:hypothetical protein
MTKNLQSVFCLILLVFGLAQCSSQDKSGGSSTGTTTGALTGPATFTIRLPPRVPAQSIGAGANDTLLIADRTTVRTPSGAAATVANLGSAQTNLGTDTRVGNVWSVGSVVLRDRARVEGFIRSQSGITVPPTASVTPGPVVANTAFTPLDSVSWTVTFPSPTGDVFLGPNARRTLQPGSFGALTVQPTARLTLTTGTYYFQSLDFEPQAVVTLDDRNGPISIYVANSVIYRASVSDTANKPTTILLGYAGTAPVSIEAPFIGTFVAPAARVTVGSFTHRGAFFAKGLEILPGATLVAQSFSALPALEVEPSTTVSVEQPVYVKVRATLPGFAVPLTYHWSVATTPPGLRFRLEQSGATGTFTGIDPGVFTVTITVTDQVGRQVSFNTPIRVLQAQLPPDRPDRLNPNAEIIQRPCRDGDETLAQFAARCDKAMGGVTVPAFDCEAPTATEPPRQGNGSSCEAPNVLNTQCDPGSHFQVLHRNVGNDGIHIVAHCRHIAVDGNTAGQYGDVAVIQYNSNTGATCFYQALRTGLSHNAPAPSTGDTTYWKTPAQTAGINCVRCHDTGPIVRSPYLAQLGQVWPFYNDLANPNNPAGPSSLPAADANYLPGTLLSELAGPWNATQPYGFVGLNFQSWEAYALKNDADPTCSGCHRMGVSRSVGFWNPGGTSRVLGIRATNATQTDSGAGPKLPHGKLSPGVSSPIWMAPGQFTSKDETTSSAGSMKACAEGVANGAPPAGCGATRFASGDTCPPPPVVVNGATSATDPTSWKGGGKTPLGQPGGRTGFYYFTSVHGPFYQNSPWDTYMNAPPAVADPPWDPPTNAPSFRGTYLRIYIEPAGQWMLAWGLDATDIQNANNDPPPPGGPGGAIEGVAFDQIDSILDPATCGTNYYSVTDQTGNNSPLFATVDAAAGARSVILAGLIGNVSRGSVFDGEGGLFATSYLAVENSGSATVLTQSHENIPVNQWFTGESWAHGCTNWQAGLHYAAHGTVSFDDVLLVPIADVAHTICYIDGIGGDWSKWVSNGQGGSVQPYAQIYIDPATGYRLKVSPSTSNDPSRISASATCLYLKN